eukprot:841306-Prorocentrum_minimum.AAC.1
MIDILCILLRIRRLFGASHNQWVASRARHGRMAPVNNRWENSNFDVRVEPWLPPSSIWTVLRVPSPGVDVGQPMAVCRQGMYVEHLTEYSKCRALNGTLVSTMDRPTRFTTKQIDVFRLKGRARVDHCCRFLEPLARQGMAGVSRTQLFAEMANLNPDS